MKLNKALNQKNKLVTELNKFYDKIAKYNSTIEGSKVPYDVKNTLLMYQAKQEELIRLKTAVHGVSQPVRNKIFRLSELKSYAKKLSQLNTRDGLVKEHSYRGDGEAVNYIAIINEVELEEMVKTVEKEIEGIQEELDQFNYNTEVAW